MKRQILIGLFFISFLSSCFGDNNDIVIVSNNRAYVDIVVETDASDQVKDAAKFFQRMVEESTGVKLEIRSQKSNLPALFIGVAPGSNLDSGTLDEDGFILSGLGDDDFVIVGGSDWGTEFGVYDFLDRFLGIKWLMPGDKWTEIPKSATIIVPKTTIESNPHYLSRRLAPINVLETNSQGVWGRHNRLRNRIEFNHNLFRIFPVDEFGKSNPEFYPLIGGKRYIPKDKNDQTWQPNFSAKGIDDAAAEKIIRSFDKNPQLTSASLAINDSKNFDQSKASASRRSGKTNYLGDQDVSDEYFSWVNSVVRKVNAKYPDKKFGLLAYNNLAEPPSFEIDKNVVPFITYELLKWVKPELKKQGLINTQRWDNAANRVGWYDYVYGFSYLLPRVWFHHMKDYLILGVENNVQYYVSELYPNWGEGPKAWLLAKLLWNPYQDVDSLLNEWYVAAVGDKAAPKLKDYYEIWENFWTVEAPKTSWWTDNGQYLAFNNDKYLSAVTEQDIIKCDQLMQQMQDLAATDTHKARVNDLLKAWKLYRSAILYYKNNKKVIVINSGRTQESSFEKFADGSKFENVLDSLESDSLLELAVGYIRRYFNPQTSKLGSQTFLKENKIDKEKSLAVMSRVSDRLAKNGSFEEGKAGWGSWLGKTDKGNFSISTDKVRSGTSSLVGSNINLGSIYQDLAYQKGKYIAKLSILVPDDNTSGEFNVLMKILDNQKKTVKNRYMSQEHTVPFIPGEWTDIAVEFDIESSENQSNPSLIRFQIDLKGFAHTAVFVDNVEISKYE